MKRVLLGLAVGAMMSAAGGLIPAAHADTAVQGQICYNWHAQVQDTNGRTLSCVHGTDTGHLMYWQYGGFTDAWPPGWAHGSGFKTVINGAAP